MAYLLLKQTQQLGYGRIWYEGDQFSHNQAYNPRERKLRFEGVYQ